VDGAGNLYVAVASGVRRVSPDGIITTVFHDFAGNLAADSRGNLFISSVSCPDDDCRFHIRKLSATGDLSEILDMPEKPIGETCNVPTAVAVDGAGAVFVAQPICNQIGKVGPDGVITIIAGQPQATTVPATSATVDWLPKRHCTTRHHWRLTLPATSTSRMTSTRRSASCVRHGSPFRG
jgi:hypothetical protein